MLSNQINRRFKFRFRLNLLQLVLISVFAIGCTGGIAFSQAALQQNVQLTPIASDGSINKRFAPPIGQANAPLEMRMLIISAIEDDGNMVAMRYLFEQYGVPYDIFVASRQDLTINTLVNAQGHGRYQGIVLSTGNLGVNRGGQWVSAFSDAEWQLLWQYERDFNVRQLVLYTSSENYPENLGTQSIGGYRSAIGNPSRLRLTPEASSIFPSIKQSATITVRYGGSYPARLSPITNGTVTPLLIDENGNYGSVLTRTAEGREIISMMMAQNKNYLHTLVMGYDLVDWLSQGVFVGERRMFLHLDIDDWFQNSLHWDERTRTNRPESQTFRISGSDALAALDQLKRVRSRYPQARNLRYSVAYVGEHAALSDPLSCDRFAATLTSATRCIGNEFGWINHTFTERVMNSTDYETTLFEITHNLTIAQQLGIDVHPTSVVTSAHSGLGHFPGPDGVLRDYGLRSSNPSLLRAMIDSGVRFAGANRSVASHTADCDSCGIWHPLEPRLMIVPRWPTNVYFNVTNPTEALSEYNTIQKTNIDYATFLDREKEIALKHVLSGSVYPHFFHQTNFHEYAPGHSLVSDWTEAVVEGYSQYFDLPLVSFYWDATTDYVEKKTKFSQNEVVGLWDRPINTVHLSSRTGGVAYLTGTHQGNGWSYGNAKVSEISLAPGVRVSIPIR